MATQAINFSSNATKVVAIAQAQEQILSLLPGLIADMLLGVSGVEYAFVEIQAGGVFHVWTVVDNPQDEVYDAIYDREKLIIKQFHPIPFDFQVIARRGKDLRSVISLACRGWRKIDF
jgi:hypothetical protein